ncbi:MAG: methyl-accepting chemotaxis protein [Betaproteobacteria bacterium]
MVRKLPLRWKLPLLIIAFAIIPAAIIGLFLSATGQQAIRTVSRGMLRTGQTIIASSTEELARLSERMLNRTSDELISTGQQGVERVGRELSSIGQKSIRESSAQIAGAAGQAIREVNAATIDTMHLNLEKLLGNLLSTTKEALTEATHATVEERASRLAIQAGELLGQEVEALVLSAQVSELRTLDPTKAKATLMALQSKRGFLRLALLNGEGKQVAAYGFPLKEGFATRPEFKRPYERGEQHVSPIMWEETRKIPFVRVAAPVFLYGKKVAGVLVGDVSLQSLANLVAREEASGYVFVADEEGRVIAHTDRQVAMERQDLSGLGPVQAGLEGKSGALEFSDSVWGKMVAGYAPVPGRKWVVVVAEKEVFAYRKISEMQSTIQDSLSETESAITRLANERARQTQNALIEPVEAAVKQASRAMNSRSVNLMAQIVGEMRQRSQESLQGSLRAMAPKAKEASAQASATMLPHAERQLTQTSRRFQSVGTIILLACAVVATVLSLLLLRGIIKPIRQLVHGAKTVAEGDLRHQVILESGDELGELSAAFTQMEGNLQDLIAGIKEASTRILALANSLVQASAEVGRSSEYVAKTMSDLAAGASDTAGSVDRTVHEAQAVATQVEQTVKAAQKAAAAVQDSNQAVSQGREVLEELIGRINTIAVQGEESLSRMGNLRQSSEEIGQITEIISSIAEQTNLLALNAAIEAARAGAHGRGFAVVAEEVRKLAEQSQQAVKRISGLVDKIQRETDRLVEALESDSVQIKAGVNAVGGAREAFGAIAEAATAIDSEVQGIMAAAETLNQSSQVMARAMEEISSLTEETAASAEEVGANAEEQAASVQQINRLAQDLTGLAQDLLDRVGQFKLATGEGGPTAGGEEGRS